MGTRRNGREAAFQLLFQIDIANLPHSEVMEEFWSQMSIEKEAREFATKLIEGTSANMEEIDKLISGSSHNWKLGRMNSVDRSILRLGVYELKFCTDTPTKVIINEAIEIGKKFGTQESSSFINGLLDKISKEVRVAE